MSFTFSDAVRERTNLLIGLAGPSGSGKTLSALRLARGLVAGDDTKIFFIDTEQGRGLHYAVAPNEHPSAFKFRFKYLKLEAPFSPQRYEEAIVAARRAGAGVIIVDSQSHSHEGPGGVLEMHEAVLTKMAGATDYAKRERMKFAAWIEPKAKHNRFVNTVLQQPCHIIFNFRAKNKLAMVKNKQGKMEPVQIGWTAICSDRLEYEMALLLMLPPNSKGVPDLEAEQTKLPEAFRSLVKPGQPIDENLGKALAAWAAGGAAPAPRRIADEPATLSVTLDDQGRLSSKIYQDRIAAEKAAEAEHDPETGEITATSVIGRDNEGRIVSGIPLNEPDIFPPHEPPQPSAEEVETIRAWANKTIASFGKVTEASFIDGWLASSKIKTALARAHSIDPEAAMAVVTAADARKKKIEQEKFTGDTNGR